LERILWTRSWKPNDFFFALLAVERQLAGLGIKLDDGLSRVLAI
jgi:hypothetical protein